MQTEIRRSKKTLIMPMSRIQLNLEQENLQSTMVAVETFSSLYSFRIKKANQINELANIKRKIEEILNSVEIPYNKGKAYYYLDYRRKEINIFIPVERLRGEVGTAVVQLFKIFEKEMPEWHVDIRAKLSQIDTWGISVKDLIETDL